MKIREFSESRIRKFLASRSKPDKETGCIIFTGAKNDRGYGIVSTGRYENGKYRNERAHRLSYILNKSPLPKGLVVCHRCDNPPCINPEHLFAGTMSDNTQDCLKKGRHNARNGNTHPCSKLTAENVIEARNLYSLGVDSVALAKRFKVSRSTMDAAIRGVTWASAGAPAKMSGNKGGLSQQLDVLKKLIEVCGKVGWARVADLGATSKPSHHRISRTLNMLCRKNFINKRVAGGRIGYSYSPTESGKEFYKTAALYCLREGV